MTEREQAEKLAKAAPPLNDKEIEEINGSFPHFIFRRSRTWEIWTTCCRQYHKLPERAETNDLHFIMSAEHQREPKNRWNSKNKPAGICPYCGKPVFIKELGRTGRRENLTSYRRAVVLRWYRGTLWARAYDCEKLYFDAEQLTAPPASKLVGVYRFRPGLAEGTGRSWYSSGFTSMQVQNGPLTGGHWNVHDPFSYNSEYGTGFDVIGISEVEKSPFRYCQAKEFMKKSNDILEFLEACCFYPKQIEMLMKAGMAEVVKDLTGRGVKHADAINWNEEDPRRAFGLTGQELRAFLETHRDVEALALYRRLKGRATMQEVDDWTRRGARFRDISRAAKEWGIPTERLIRYLSQQDRRISRALTTWRDYLAAAQAIGEPLHRENVLLPKNLGPAHDSATARHQARLERERRAEAEEKKRLVAMSYKKRKLKLERKYGFSMDGYLIRVPSGEDEIVAEGKALKHCVGGYARRHMSGAATILFMRAEKTPDKPWLTIEMNGNQLVQIHGYKNEGLYTSGGRFAPDPRQVYREFLDTWLDWLKKGSKRDKQGLPVLPKSKSKKGTAA